MGGMLPEQIWDYADYPQEDMYFGKSAGSAQPLVWAHSEYLKLLKSTVDGKVFDCISVVRDRYAAEPGKRTFQSNVEIFQTSRPVRTLKAGMTLRVVDTVHFSVLYTCDDWTTKTLKESWPLGYLGNYADITTKVGQKGKIVFTFHWTVPDKWLGWNIEVEIV